MKKRIWELDALRGLLLLLMVLVHLYYDLAELFAFAGFSLTEPFRRLMAWGGVSFVLLSGCCASLGSHPLRRGMQVLACGLLVSAVTAGLALVSHNGAMAVRFGVLHCLGCCMILWVFLRKMPSFVLIFTSVWLILAGLWLRQRSFSFSWLLPLGFMPRNFVTVDYFPLLPHLGFFLLGAVVGKRLCRRGNGLLPEAFGNRKFFRFLGFCGRHSLLIYLLHQPVITGLLWSISLLA